MSPLGHIVERCGESCCFYYTRGGGICQGRKTGKEKGRRSENRLPQSHKHIRPGGVSGISGTLIECVGNHFRPRMCSLCAVQFHFKSLYKFFAAQIVRRYIDLRKFFALSAGTIQSPHKIAHILPIFYAHFFRNALRSHNLTAFSYSQSRVLYSFHLAMQDALISIYESSKIVNGW